MGIPILSEADRINLKLSYETYLDKVLGAWIGKSLGGIIGGPFEGHKALLDLTAENCWPASIMPNDDLDIQVVWLEMLEERGSNFSSSDLVEMWQDRCWYNFSEYGYFLYNVQRGIMPPLSGRFNNIFYSESMGCPIRAEIWGLVSPGNPLLAAELAKMDGELDHIDNSVWAEQFWAAAISAAFTAKTVEEALAVGRSAVPVDSEIFRISLEVPELHSSLGDYRHVWLELIRRYGHRDCTKVMINFAFTVLSLLEGNGDLKKTIITTVNCTWDADCTAATAAALIGVLKGSSALPEDWKERMGDRLMCDVAVRHKTALLTDLAIDTCKVGLEMSLARNRQVLIPGVPDVIMEEVKARYSNRQPPQTFSIHASYLKEPVLYRDKSSTVILQIKSTDPAQCSGQLTIASPAGTMVSPHRVGISIAPGIAQELVLNIRRDSVDRTIWDKNLFTASWKAENGYSHSQVFGLAGSRQWLVYGPYWDDWDTGKFDVCPFRNSEVICPPWSVEGCGGAEFRQFVRLDRDYLDESALFKRNLPAERPVLIEKGEDHIDARDLGGFIGEACYYLVREVVAREPLECLVRMGSTGPFAVWMDGKDVYRNEQSSSWGCNDHCFSARFDSTPRRLVIKCLRSVDDFRFSMCFGKLDIPGDKTMGISYLEDCFGDIAVNQ